MHKLILMAVCVASLSLGGCASILGAGLPEADKLPVTQQFMEQYSERCKGHFWGSLGLAGTTGFDINCEPPKDAVAAPPAAPTDQALVDALKRALKEVLAEAQPAP